MKIYALANELNLDRSNTGTITIPFGTWDYGQKKLPDGRTLFFRQTLDLQGASAIAAQIADSIAKGEKGVPVYWGHPDVPELAHKYPDKRAKGWITSASVEDGKLVLSVDWLEDKATDGFGWFSPFWTGPVKENGDGTALMHVESLASVALVNMPNIQEFRLANELQGGFKDNERKYAVPQNLIELSRRYDARMAKLANEFDESKHPRDEQGQLAAKRDGVVKLANVIDANGLSHGEDGKFDGGNGGGGKAGSGDLKSRMRRNTGTAPDGDRGWETDRDGRAVGGFRMGRSTQNVAEEGARLVARFRGGDRRARAQGINEQLSFNRSRIRGEKDYWNRQTESEMRRATHRAAMYLGLRYDLRTHRYE